MTLKLISTVEVGSGGASSIDFTSIPATFTDLVIMHSIRTNQSATDSGLRLDFNATTTTFTARFLYGTGSATGSGTDLAYLAGNATGNSATSNTFGNGTIYVPNYLSSAAKSFSSDAVTENNATGALQIITAGLWNGTSAITAIKLYIANSSTLLQYSTASLYGIQKGSGGATAA